MLSGFLQAQRARIAFGPAVEFDRADTGRDRQEQATVAIQGAVESLRQFAIRA
jgi:hypothetical protein